MNTKFCTCFKPDLNIYIYLPVFILDSLVIYPINDFSLESHWSHGWIDKGCVKWKINTVLSYKFLQSSSTSGRFFVDSSME